MYISPFNSLTGISIGVDTSNGTNLYTCLALLEFLDIRSGSVVDSSGIESSFSQFVPSLEHPTASMQAYLNAAPNCKQSGVSLLPQRLLISEKKFLRQSWHKLLV